MDNKPGFTGDRALPEATAIMARQADRLYEVGDELKKRPILRAAVVGVASELGEAAEDAWPYAREYADDLAGMERLAREEVAAVAKAHVCRLPSRSGWRRKLMEVGELDHEFAVEKVERRMGEDPQEVAEDRRNAGGPPPDVIALGNLIRAITGDLDQVDDRWASALNHFADRLDRSGIDAPEDIEPVAIRSMSILAAHFADLLPAESPWRKLLGELSEAFLEEVEGPSLASVMADVPRGKAGQEGAEV